MVKSGLIENTTVSHYRLAITFKFSIYTFFQQFFGIF